MPLLIRSVAVAVAAVTLTVLAAACADSPPASATASSDAAAARRDAPARSHDGPSGGPVEPLGPPSAPLPPPAMNASTRDAAELAAAHVLDLYDHAVETRDVAALTQMCAPGVAWCTEQAEALGFRSVVPADRPIEIRTSHHEIDRVVVEPTLPGTWQVRVDAHHERTTRWVSEAGRAATSQAGGGPVRYEMELARRLTGWVVLDVTSTPLT